MCTKRLVGQTNLGFESCRCRVDRYTEGISRGGATWQGARRRAADLLLSAVRHATECIWSHCVCVKYVVCNDRSNHNGHRCSHYCSHSPCAMLARSSLNKGRYHFAQHHGNTLGFHYHFFSHKRIIINYLSMIFWAKRRLSNNLHRLSKWYWRAR